MTVVTLTTSQLVVLEEPSLGASTVLLQGLDLELGSLDLELG